MVFEPKYEKMVSSIRKRIGTTQATVECRLPINDNVEVVKVLCANAKVISVKGSNENNKVHYSGNVGFQVVFIDNLGNTEGLDYTAEFRDSTNADIDVNSVPIVSALVIDVKCEPRKEDVKVVAIIEVNIDEIQSSDNKALIDVANENIFVRKEIVKNTSYSGIAYEKFEVVGDLEIDDSLQKILSVCMSGYMENLTQNKHFITIIGGINIDICYLSDDSKIRTYQNTLDFTQDIASEDINENTVIQNVLDILSNDAKITTNLDGDKAEISVVIPVEYTGYVFNNSELEIVQDVFSTENYLTTEFEQTSYLNGLPTLISTERIIGATTLDDSQNYIDEILGATCSKVLLANSEVADGELVLEGVANTTVLYFNRELNNINSVEIEMPFSLNINLQNNSENLQANTMVTVGDVVAKSKRGKEIEINAKLFICADLFNISENTIIEKVEESGIKDKNDLVLIIYIVKDGDTIWEIAKDLNISPELIMEQNPDLELPLKLGDKIVIYKQGSVRY